MLLHIKIPIKVHMNQNKFKVMTSMSDVLDDICVLSVTNTMLHSYIEKKVQPIKSPLTEHYTHSLSTGRQETLINKLQFAPVRLQKILM